MTAGKLDLSKDLKFGTLNALEDVNVSNSGDRRRTSSLASLNSSTAKAYSKNSLRRRQRFNGIVVHRRKITMPRYSDRMSLLETYVASSGNPQETGTSGSAVPEEESTGVSQSYQTAGRTAYKVYIPELEPRPAPASDTDPVLRTYPDVFAVSGRPDLEMHPIGAVVEVIYEDPNRLFNPQIAEGHKDRFILMANFEASQTNQELWAGAVPSVMGDGTGPPFLPGFPARAHPDAPYITKMSEAARTKKRKAESMMLKLYNDPYGLCTIGIGHLVDGHKSCQTLKDEGSVRLKAEWLKGGLPKDGKNTRAPNETMTADEAEALFIKDIESREETLVSALKNANNVKVTQNQFDALMSAVFNSGQGNVNKHIIKPHLREKNPPDLKGAAEAFTVYGRMGYYREGHEKHLPGLIRLREKERTLFYQA